MDVQEGYMLFRGVIWMFKWVLFRGVILDFSTPVVDIAASSWSLTWLDWLASWGCSRENLGGGSSSSCDPKQK